MPQNLETGWVKIATSGPTLNDGRVIDPQWLRDMAETYSLETYTAMIWPEHLRWFGNYGKVAALKAEEADGVVSLFAKLQPNDRLLAANKEGQRLFCSIEVVEKYAGTGKTYLGGLGVTDEPASLGTSELRFKDAGSTLLPGVQLAFETPDDDLPPSWFSKIFPLLRGKPEEENMDKEQFQQLVAKLDEQAQAMKELGDKFAQAAPQQEQAAQQQPAPQEAEHLQHESGQDNGQNEFQVAIDQIAELGKAFKALTERLENATPGVIPPVTSAPAADKQGLV